jgi:hypothetical protein
MFDAIAVDADHDVGDLVDHVGAVADLHHQRIDVDGRIDRIQRAGLPGLDLLRGCRR